MWTRSEMTNWLNCCFFMISSCKINIFMIETSTIQCILIDFLLILSNVNFLSSFWFWMTLYSCDFAIDAISRSLKKRHIEVVIWLFDKNILLCFCCSRRSINFWECFWYFDFWCRHRDAKIEIIVLEWLLDDLSIKYEEFISHECFDKLRRFFQSLWRFWFVITAMKNQEFETIDACRWKRQWDRMIETTCCNCKFLVMLNSIALEVLFENFFLVAFQARVRSLDWTIRDSKAIQSVMIAIFSCIEWILHLRFVSRSDFCKIDISFESNVENVVMHSVVENTQLFDCQLYTSDANLMIIVIIRM